MAYGRISDDDMQKIREATDLVTLVGERTQLKQRGREYWCCCPLHHEKTPSFKIDPATQLWHCFGCDQGGDVFGFVMAADELSFPEAARKLAERAHIEISETASSSGSNAFKNRLKEVCKTAAEFFHLQLMRSKSQNAANARAYLSGRDLGGEVPKEWDLGFAPGGGTLVSHLASKGFSNKEMLDANVAVVGKDGKVRDRFFNRVMFPINDVNGEVIAFGGRILGDGNPKYLNSQETPIFHKSKVLYGLDKAKAQMASTGIAIVAEGYTDVIALHRAGLANSVATLGTALTQNHIRQLSRHAGKKIVYLFDGDEAGQRATERALKFIDDSITPESGKRRLDLCALTLPDGMDPAEFIQARGSDAMKLQIHDAKPLILFGIERRLAKHDKGTAEGRAQALADALDILAPIKDSILAKDYAVQIANMLHFREDDVLAQLAKLKKPPVYSETSSERPSHRAPSGSEDDRFNAGAANQGQQTAASAEVQRLRPRISLSEKNRIDLEREFLGLLVQNPVDALNFADELKSIKWRESDHLLIAEVIMKTLMDNLNATPAQIIEEAQAAFPQAPSILTSARAREGVPASVVLKYLSEELAIGDLEDEINQMKHYLPNDEAKSDSSNDSFQMMIELQKRLSEMKAQHVQLP